MRNGGLWCFMWGAERTDAIFARLPPNLSYREYGMGQVDLGSRPGCISQPVHHLMPANRFMLISVRTSRVVWSAYIVQSVREVRGEGSRTAKGVVLGPGRCESSRKQYSNPCGYS